MLERKHKEGEHRAPKEYNHERVAAEPIVLVMLVKRVVEAVDSREYQQCDSNEDRCIVCALEHRTDYRLASLEGSNNKRCGKQQDQMVA